MRKAMEPVYKDVAGRVGQPLIDEFLKETQGRDQLRPRHRGFRAVGAGSHFTSAGDDDGRGRGAQGRAVSSAIGMIGIWGSLMFLRILDRLEEILIASLMAAAT